MLFVRLIHPDLSPAWPLDCPNQNHQQHQFDGGLPTCPPARERFVTGSKIVAEGLQ
jgi:hypothetical protein